MNPEFLNEILGHQSKLEALRCLFSEERELTGREIARRTGLSHPIIHKALRKLEKEGIVKRNVTPPNYQFQLNKGHWVVDEILSPLFEKESGWLDYLFRFITQRTPKSVVSVILFGSIVKGTTTPKSDIDILVLVVKPGEKEPVREHFFNLGRKVYLSFQRPLAPIILSVDEFRNQYKSGRKFAKEISYTGRVIYGRLLTEILFEHGAKKG